MTPEVPPRALVRLGLVLVAVLVVGQILGRVAQILICDWRAWTVLAAVSVGCYLAIRPLPQRGYREAQSRERVPHEFGSRAGRDSTDDKWT
jgi:hypothetical protein